MTAPTGDTSPADPLLRIAGVSKRFGGIVAVDDISIDVARHRVTGLIGPNGAGKTTLFDLISGVSSPNSGEVLFEGRPIQGMQSHAVARLGIGRTFQSVRVFNEMTVRENLEVADRNGKHRGSQGFADRMGGALAFVNMTPHQGALAGRLSYGQRKLIEIAMVLIQDPKLIMLDEPVAGVNPKLIEQIGELLTELVRQRRTLLLVEHNIPFVTSLCDHIIVMANGKLLAQGDGEQVQRDPRVLEAFLGT
ncbi:MAG TPA: ABC transporter ATP-binding protein [Pseudolabrys sp.]|nr:ABC transporter ATP-binding protein [Pseudolabrys sp.]